MSIPILLIAVVAATSLLLWTLISNWKHAQKALKWGCGRAPVYPGDHLGIIIFKDMFLAEKAQKLLPLFDHQFATMTEREGRDIYTFSMKHLGGQSYMTADPKNIQAVLATQFGDFDLGANRRDAMYPLMGHSIGTNEGQEWARSRALLRPQFARDQISDLDLEERHVQNVMKVLPVMNGRWTNTVNLQKIFFRFTIDSVTEFFFGKSVHSQLSAFGSQDTPQDRFCASLDKSVWYTSQRIRFGKLSFLLNTPQCREVEREVHHYVDKHVQEAIEYVQKQKREGKLETDSRYVFLHELAAVTQDPIRLRCELLLTLMAGRDTTAAMLTWTMLLLARNPDKFRKLRQEILCTFGTYRQPRDISFTTLKGCRYLQYCMQESLRLYPVAPVNSRTATKDTTLPRGGGPDGSDPIYIRKGEVVSYTVHVLHRRKDLWGPDAHAFRPERWANRKASWDWLPFNGGPRICLGQQFALTEAGYILVRLLQRFDAVEDINADREIRVSVTLGSLPAEGTAIRLREAME